MCRAETTLATDRLFRSLELETFTCEIRLGVRKVYLPSRFGERESSNDLLDSVFRLSIELIPLRVVQSGQASRFEPAYASMRTL